MIDNTSGHPGRESRSEGEKPSRYRSAAYSRASLARLALSEQASALADMARGLVPTTSDAHARDGELVSVAAPLAVTARELLTLAVVYERTKGTSWEQIGVALGITRQAAHERYAPAVRDFHERVLRAWLQPERAGEVLATSDHLAQLVARLSTWVAAHGELDEIDHGDQPIAAGLQPMDTAERATLISQASALLLDMPTDPAVDDRQRHDLEIGLCRRKIELYEDMAAEAPGDTDVLQDLAGARARLTELQAGPAS